MFKARKSIGQRVKVIGWFKRTPRPILLIHRMEVENVGDTKTFWRFTRYFVLWIITAAAIGLIVYGLGLIPT